MAEPAEGLRVELRPVDSGLAALHQEVQKLSLIHILTKIGKALTYFIHNREFDKGWIGRMHRKYVRFQMHFMTF